MYHVPMCVMCGENEVGTFQAHDQFCGDMCADRYQEALEVEKFYDGWTEDEADYHADWKDEQAQEDADWRDLASMDTSGSYSYEEPDSWEDVAAQWDDDPNPYAGTYSEE